MSIYEIKNFIPTYLYIKQHNDTGLKYFGKTIKRNPIKYRGSGKYWRNHLKKYGNNVTTIWYKLFENKEELVNYALTFSKENNIVDSKEWANIIVENGLDGGNPFWGQKTSERWNSLTEEEKQHRNEANRESLKEYWKNVPDNERKVRVKLRAIGVKNHWDNSTIEERKARATKSGAGHRGKRRMQSPDLTIPPKMIMLKDQQFKLDEGWFYPPLKWKKCEYCNERVEIGNYSRNHGEKCKSKN